MNELFVAQRETPKATQWRLQDVYKNKAHDKINHFYRSFWCISRGDNDAKAITLLDQPSADLIPQIWILLIKKQKQKP